MNALTGSTRISFLFFFISHVPATVLLDGQGSFLPIPYPRPLVDFVDWYAVTLNDPLFLAKPTWLWLSAFLTGELCLQLPYFFVAIHMLISKKGTDIYPEWFRLASLIYGAHTATTLVPILQILLTNPDATPFQRLFLSTIYFPYLVFPVWLIYLCAKAAPAHATMTPFTGSTYYAYLGFFASHIPITLCIDGQAALHASMYPKSLQNFVSWYAATFHDALMTAPFDTWFVALVWCECLFQFPYFITAVQMMLSGAKEWPEWFRTASIVYGAHTSTTLLPIMVEICFNEKASSTWRLYTFLLYSPYLLFPAGLVYMAVKDSLMNTTPKQKGS
jgi:hypothetical protein